MSATEDQTAMLHPGTSLQRTGRGETLETRYTAKGGGEGCVEIFQFTSCFKQRVLEFPP